MAKKIITIIILIGFTAYLAFSEVKDWMPANQSKQMLSFREVREISKQYWGDISPKDSSPKEEEKIIADFGSVFTIIILAPFGFLGIFLFELFIFSLKIDICDYFDIRGIRKTKRFDQRLLDIVYIFFMIIFILLFYLFGSTEFKLLSLIDFFIPISSFSSNVNLMSRVEATSALSSILVGTTEIFTTRAFGMGQISLFLISFPYMFVKKHYTYKSRGKMSPLIPQILILFLVTNIADLLEPYLTRGLVFLIRQEYLVRGTVLTLFVVLVPFTIISMFKDCGMVSSYVFATMYYLTQAELSAIERVVYFSAMGILSVLAQQMLDYLREKDIIEEDYEPLAYLYAWIPSLIVFVAGLILSYFLIKCFQA